MIFGGLEIVAGGYLIHRHHKHKNAKKREAAELEARRHNTFPGARPAGHSQDPQLPPPHYQQPIVPQHKYACYAAPVAPQPQAQHPQSNPGQHPVQAQAQPRPGPPQHSHTFDIPRRPVPDRKPQIIIQPSLQRTDSLATLSRMPIANGYRPHGVAEHVPPPRVATGNLQPATISGVYGNPGYSVSTPALGATPTSPALTYTFATSPQSYRDHSTYDDWETHGHHADATPHYAPSEVSTQLGERDPPPPYMP